MSYWQVSNHKLYSGTGADNKTAKFIVGTEFPFDSASYTNSLSAAYSGTWTGTDPKANRAAAGNTILMWGNWFGSTTASLGAQRLLSCFSQNPGITNFIPWVDLYDYSDASFPRGQHSYVTNYTTYVTNGHWTKIPCTSGMPYGENAATDTNYIWQYSGSYNNSQYWYQDPTYSNLNGTELWHKAWLSGVLSGSVNGNYYSNKLAAWYLMDEPFNPERHRDYTSNQFSVSGHSAFCTAIEGTNLMPKMVGPGGTTNADTQYTAISGAIGIVAGNYYGGGNITRAWWTPNMVAWMNSKISTSTTKMIIPWLWGSYNDITYSRYVFYGSLIEGARGVLWWMSDGGDFWNYTHQKSIYSNFTNGGVFNSVTGLSDNEIFLSGTELTLTNMTTAHNNEYPDTSYYPKIITNAASIKAFSYTSNGNNRWRIYAVNHTNASTLLSARITGTPPNTIAYKSNSSSYVTLSNQGTSLHLMTDTLTANQCQIYDIG